MCVLGTGCLVKLVAVLLLVGALGCAVFVEGEFGAPEDYDLWIVVGLALITVSLIGGLALIGSHDPRALRPVCAATAAICAVAAIICLLASHPKYAMVFGFGTTGCGAGYFVIRRSLGLRYRRLQPLAGYCPNCLGRLGPEDERCPWCGLALPFTS